MWHRTFLSSAYLKDNQIKLEVTREHYGISEICAKVFGEHFIFAAFCVKIIMFLENIDFPRRIV